MEPWVQFEHRSKEADDFVPSAPGVVEVSSEEEDSDASSLSSPQRWTCPVDDCIYAGHSANALMVHRRVIHASKATADRRIDGQKDDERASSAATEATGAHQENDLVATATARGQQTDVDTRTQSPSLLVHQSAQAEPCAQLQSTNRAHGGILIQTPISSADNLLPVLDASGTEIEQSRQSQPQHHEDQVQEEYTRAAGILLNLGQTPWKPDTVPTVTATKVLFGLDGTSDGN